MGKKKMPQSHEVTNKGNTETLLVTDKKSNVDSKKKGKKKEYKGHGQRARCWVFTNFQNVEMGLKLNEIKDARYILYQEELCPSTKKPHLQGYVQFNNPIEKRQVQKRINRGKIWCKPAKGEPDQCHIYCTKDESAARNGNEKEEGKMTKQGNRTDIQELRLSVVRNPYIKINDLWRTHGNTFVRCPNLVKELKQERQQEKSKEFRQNKVIIWLGDPGRNKTRSVLYDEKDKPKDNVYRITKPTKDLWWTGYMGEETLVIDDFTGWISYEVMLQITDGHQERLDIKGSFTYAMWKKVIIISNMEFKKWWPEQWHEDKYLALQRRIFEMKDELKKESKNILAS